MEIWQNTVDREDFMMEGERKIVRDAERGRCTRPPHANPTKKHSGYVIVPVSCVAGASEDEGSALARILEEWALSNRDAGKCDPPGGKVGRCRGVG